jgi:transposase-like protein/IS1 family transposase
MDATTTTPTPTTCREPECSGRVIRWGKDKGVQRWRCKDCGATFADRPVNPMGSMRIDPERAALILGMLTEGSSIRSAERLTGTHRDTICRLLRVAGAKAEAILSKLVRQVEVEDVQADEIWGYVGMKEKTKVEQGISHPQVGDAYTFVGFERHSKLVLSWHLGRRTAEDTHTFMGKLAGATEGRFQLTTDGFHPYPGAVEEKLGARVDFAVLQKNYGTDAREDQRRYSPAAIIGTEKQVIYGNPEESRVCTSHVERQNLHMRMQVRRLTRLTNAFSKKWENLKAALALHFWAFNFAWMHSAIRMTPAMKAGICRKPLRVADLLAA